MQRNKTEAYSITSSAGASNADRDTIVARLMAWVG
jgi:hypothetical protein